MHSFSVSELSILLVEPSSVQLKIIMRELHQAGITKIDNVHSGDEAIAMLQKYPPDLVISAMYLPDMTATELLSAIRGLETLDNTHFMLISSESKTEALEPLRQSGVVAILPKPFDHANLRRAIRTTLDYIDPAEITLQNYDVDQLDVLLVDDSMVSRNQLSRVLNNMGITQIHPAENGIEAIEKLKQQNFDLVVTDLNMPEMDGQALVEHIRTQMGNTFVPILVVTSEQNQARLGQVEQAGVSAILDKPFEPNAIRDILYRVLDGQD